MYCWLPHLHYFLNRRKCSIGSDGSDVVTVTSHMDKIMGIIPVDRKVCTRDIAEELSIDESTIERHWNKLGIKKKFDIWMPHDLSQNKAFGQI